MEEQFINAIREKKKIRITFYSIEDHHPIVRVCAPMDYGPSRRAKVKNNRFHVWDYDSDTSMHTLSINPQQIISMEILDEVFDPSEFINWDTKKSPWFVSREWSDYS